MNQQYKVPAVDIAGTMAGRISEGPKPSVRNALVTSTLHSLLLAAYVLLSECLQLSERNHLFMVKLGLGLVPVAGIYLAFGAVCGAVVGAAIRRPRWQFLAHAVIYFVVLSLKLFSQDASLFSKPAFVVAGVVATIGLFAAIELGVSRFRLTQLAPLLVVVAYYNVCSRIATEWTVAGGRLGAFLTSGKTILVCSLGGLLFVGAVVALTALERRGLQRRFHAVVPLTFAIATVIANCGGADRKSFVAASNNSTLPDVYVISFDALRSDHLDAFIRSHPTSHMAQLGAASTTFMNVVADGSSTYPILANNTYAGAQRPSCKGSLPHLLRERGYATTMLLGRAGKRFDGADCYDEFYSGTGDLLGKQFKLLALAAELWGSGSDSRRTRMIPSNVMVDELAASAKRMESRPAFAYAHLLDFHEPYVPRARDHDERYLQDLEELKRRCIVETCDLSSPVNAPLIDTLRRGYDEIFQQADEIVGRVLDIAKSRGRAYIVILTADHGELLGEHGGLFHGGGFVPELLDIPFVVYDTRAPSPHQRCELVLGSEALRAVALGESIAPHDSVSLSSALGRATVDATRDRLTYEIAAPNLPLGGTWRNVHRDAQGELPYPIARCTAN